MAELVVGADGMIFLDKLWADWSPSYDGSADLPHVKDSLRGPANLAAAIGYYRAMFTSGFGACAPPQPTLYLHGSEDGTFGVEGVGDTATELSEQSRVEIIDGTGHFLHLEKPDEVNRLIVKWVSGRTS
jgi:pimeloyl-ACP methyl ester carboxylesterase